MKAQNREEKQAKAQEREKLQREIAARERAERIQAEYEDRLNAMQADNEKKQGDLREALEQIRKLEDKLTQTQAAKDELEAGQNAIKGMIKQLEDSKNMEAEERARLEDEIRVKQHEVQFISDQVQRKEEENIALQRAMAEARRKHEEATQALFAATTTPGQLHVADEEDDDIPNGDTSRDLRTESDITDPVNDRLTLAERSERLQNQLKSLKEDLDHTRTASAETTMDRIHKENVRQGRDKYKTLREVRKGNTKRRVDQFENM